MRNLFYLIKSIPFIQTAFNYYFDIKNREKEVCYGNENPNNFFYVIGLPDFACGIWWIINKVIMHIAYAEDHGYLPVVDMLHYHTQYHNPEDINEINVWEKFFEQPLSVSLDDISKSKHVILSCKKDVPNDKYLMGNTEFYDNPVRLKYFQDIFKRYIRFSRETEMKLQEMRDSVMPQDVKILGVLCRGTDYLLKKPKNHPVQPEPQVVIKDAEAIMKKYGCDYVFLATEDQDILDMFKSHFGTKLKYIKQNRVTHEQMKNVNRLMSISSKSNRDKYLMGVEYLSATYILSKCHCFIGGRCGGTKGVLLMNDNFEYKFIYNLGFYE